MVPVKVVFGSDVRRIALADPVSYDELAATVAKRFSKVCLSSKLFSAVALHRQLTASLYHSCTVP